LANPATTRITDRRPNMNHPYLYIYLAGIATAIFPFAMVYALILAFRTPPPTRYGRRKTTVPPNMAQVPVVEAGIVAYQFLGVTGEEQS
jgi:hypothetical protein